MLIGATNGLKKTFSQAVQERISCLKNPAAKKVREPEKFCRSKGLSLCFPASNHSHRHILMNQKGCRHNRAYLQPAWPLETELLLPQHAEMVTVPVLLASSG
jgi:hypothetical protein